MGFFYTLANKKLLDYLRDIILCNISKFTVVQQGKTHQPCHLPAYLIVSLTFFCEN